MSTPQETIDEKLLAKAVEFMKILMNPEQKEEAREKKAMMKQFIEAVEAFNTLKDRFHIYFTFSTHPPLMMPNGQTFADWYGQWLIDIEAANENDSESDDDDYLYTDDPVFFEPSAPPADTVIRVKANIEIDDEILELYNDVL